jgi:hypothetical protein
MHPQLTLIAAQQHIADLHRAADHNRLVHTATTSSRPRTPPRRRRASLVPALAPPPPGAFQQSGPETPVRSKDQDSRLKLVPVRRSWWDQ